ncbi:MAG TPA: hypothetical protein VHA52_07890 [Candidatus Babeliaceae bacterium]|nr:hypothetical protein [Candidatus Babeliaceae bacterium]
MHVGGQCESTAVPGKAEVKRHIAAEVQPGVERQVTFTNFNHHGTT